MTVDTASPTDAHERSGDAASAGRDRAQRRVSVELAIVAGLLAVLAGVRWISLPGVAALPALQGLAPLTAVPAALLLSYAAGTRRWRTTAALAAVLVVHLVLLLPWWVRGPAAVDAATVDDPLVVMASNLQYGQADTDAVARAVRELDVDVLVALEATAATPDELSASGVDALLPHGVGRTREDAGGALIRSRHPLVTTAVPTPAFTPFDAPAVRVLAPSGDVLLVAAHPVPPWPGSTPWWRSDLAAFTAWAETAPASLPVVVAGDLNATTDHPELRRLLDTGLVAAHDAAGAGRPLTWPRRTPTNWRRVMRLPPLLHLDHVLVRDLGVIDAGTLPVPGSDHHAVWARLAVERT